MDYVKFKLDALPKTEFCILVKNQALLLKSAERKIAKQLGKNWGKSKGLATHLKQECSSLTNVKFESVVDSYITDWKCSKRFIPLDCFFELSSLAKIKHENLESNAKVKYRFSPNKSGIVFPKNYDENLAFFAEAIRVEGHIRKSFHQVNIANNSLKFISMLEKIAKKYVPDNSIYKILRIDSRIPQNQKILNVKERTKNLKFIIYSKSPNFYPRIAFYDKFELGHKNYEIWTDKGVLKIAVVLSVDKEPKITAFTDNIGVSTCLSICNITFAKILNTLLNIPAGKKSNTIELPAVLKISPDSVKIAAINAVLASEAWEEIKARRVRIGLNSKAYLIGLSDLFKSLSINPKLEKHRNYLAITGHKNLSVLKNKFDPILMYKQKKIENINKTYKRRPNRWNESLEKIIFLLKDKKTLTAYEISNLINKHKDTIFWHINHGLELGLISKNSIKEPYKYSLTEKGESYNVMSGI